MQLLKTHLHILKSLYASSDKSICSIQQINLNLCTWSYWQIQIQLLTKPPAASYKSATSGKPIWNLEYSPVASLQSFYSFWKIWMLSLKNIANCFSLIRTEFPRNICSLWQILIKLIKTTQAMCPNPNIAFLSSYEASNKFTLALLLELSEPGGQYTNYNQGQNRDKQGQIRDNQLVPVLGIIGLLPRT